MEMGVQYLLLPLRHMDRDQFRWCLTQSSISTPFVTYLFLLLLIFIMCYCFVLLRDFYIYIITLLFLPLFLSTEE
jgi:hypothetical protein